MEPVTTMAYAVALAGAVSIQPMTLNECLVREADRQQTLCVMVEPECSGEECGEPVVKKKQAYKKWYISRKTGKKVYRTVWR